MLLADYFAHSANSSGKKHLLLDHSVSVAKMTAAFCRKFDAEDAGFAVGANHDSGKLRALFQPKLDGEECLAEHAIVGAARVAEISQLASIPVISHHVGLKNLSYIKRINQYQRSPFADMPQDINLGNEVYIAAGRDVPPSLFVGDGRMEDPLSADLLVRMMTSALVDADRLDTEAHFRPGLGGIRDSWPSLADLRDDFHSRRLFKLSSKVASPHVMAVRQEVYESCMRAAELPSRMMTLTVPTGGGKTISSVALALERAVRLGMDRVIYAAPYITIIDQTASELKDLFGEDAVLEHHSSLELGGYRGFKNSLAAENWDAPVVVTTIIQLLGSLFSNNASKLRKLHNIVRSVIIIDEVQSIPIHLLRPTFDMLRQLTKEPYGCTVILMTATQPAYREFIPEDFEIHEIIDSPGIMFESMKRVSYNLVADGSIRDLTADEVALMASSREQALVVVNSKHDAKRIYKKLPKGSRYHLSTDMCPSHRKAVLREVMEKLEAGERCHLVATQLIEAGVDIDFREFGMRATGPLSSICQVGGRINRAGLAEMGELMMFNLVDERSPGGEYRSGSETTRSMIAEDPDLDPNSPSVHRPYFSRLYQTKPGLDTYAISRHRRELSFETVSELYRLIEEDNLPVLVGWGEGVAAIEALERRLADGIPMTRKDLRELQPFIVDVFPSALEKSVKAGDAIEMVEGLWKWVGDYDETGIIAE
jgi:CRISPR-associated endonuclease/helicase Cas3